MIDRNPLCDSVEEDAPLLVSSQDVAAVRLAANVEQTQQQLQQLCLQQDTQHNNNTVIDLTSAEHSAPTDRVPITILTGWLGSGKTTLLRRVLQAFNGQTEQRDNTDKQHNSAPDTQQGRSASRKLLVIQNEFSNVGVELELVGTSTTPYASLLEYANGCICCTIKDDFVTGLEALIADKNTNQRVYDYIIIECSGLVDVGKLIELYWLDNNLDSTVYLDSVICVIDAYHYGMHQYTQVDLLCINKQIAYADMILLNKCDLVQPPCIEECLHTLRQLNNVAPVQQTINADIAVDSLLYQHRFDWNAVAESLQHTSAAHPTHTHTDQCACNNNNHLHNTQIASHVIECTDANIYVDLQRFNEWLAALLWQHTDPTTPAADSAAVGGQQIYRMKGILNVQNDGNYIYYLQCVQQLFDIECSAEQWNNKQRQHSTLVIIGKNLQVDQLHQQFNRCMSTSTNQ